MMGTWSLAPRVSMAAVVVGLGMSVSHAQAASGEIWDVAPFGRVTIYAPERAPEEVVLFLSGDGGWNLGVIGMAERLRGLGALVVGIDIRAYGRHLDAEPGCAYPAGSLEQLARSVQLRARLPEYKRPILVGYSSGATLAYAALAAAPVETFAGAISLGFCPDIELSSPLCRGRALVATPRGKRVGYDLAAARDLEVPWMVLQGDIDQVCAPEQTRRYVESIPSARLFWLPKVGHGFGVTRRWDDAFVEAYRSLSQARQARAAQDLPKLSDAEVADLPLVEVPAAADPPSELMAVMMSGDGGWAAFDKGVAGELARSGVPVVGWSSLRYFWRARTPEAAAQDLARVIDHYLKAWGKKRVLLAGYSFGADVLPFMVTRLPESTRQAVAGVGLIGLGENASFEFHVSSWLTDAGDQRYPTAREVSRLNVPTVCVAESDEHGGPCRGTPARIVALPGGHHFGGDYARIAHAVLETAREASEPRAAER